MDSLRRLIGSEPGHLSTGTLLVVLLIVAGAIWSPGVIAAQVTATPGAMTCAQLLPAVQKNLSEQCNNLDRDQVCYGNPSIAVKYQDESASSSIPFKVPGNIAPISAFKSIATAPLNLEHGEWGLAVLKVQTNLPGTTAGQAVTFVLYGDTSLTNAAVASGETTPAAVACTATTTRQTFLRAAPGPNEQQVVLLPPNATANVTARLANSSWVQAEYQGQTGWLFTQVLKLSCDVSTLPINDPSQPASLPGISAFYFSTGAAAQAACKDVPPGGLLVQSPKGQKINFKLNGADITLGSTVIFRAQANQQMVMSVLEGQGIVTVGNVRQVVNAGQGVTLPLGTPNVGQGQAIIPDFALGLVANGPPGPPRPWQASELFLPSVCNLGKAAGLNVPCTVAPPATQRPRITFTPKPAQPPPPQITPTPTTVTTTGPNCTFTVQRFAADQNPAPYNPNPNIRGAQFCTTLRWDVEGSETLYLNGQGVVGHGSQFVCIQKPTTYTLTMNCGGTSKSVSYTLNPGSVPSAPG